VLTIVSGMDPHMISGNLDGFWLSLLLGCVGAGLLVHVSVIVRLRDVTETVTSEEISLLSFFLV
jgi:hypothetical protein